MRLQPDEPMDQPIGDGGSVPVDDAEAAHQAEQDAIHRAGLDEKMGTIVGRLTSLVDEQVALKVDIENRWIADLRQYHGRYDDITEARLRDAKKSRTFVKLTRTKTLAWEARITDLLFPTDEKNWAIKPTPVPALAQVARDAEASMEKAIATANAQVDAADPQHADTAASADAFAKQKAHSEGLVNEAKRRSALMEAEIEDQLIECQYPSRCREVIRDATRIGTGVTKGPMVANRNKRTWVEVAGEDGTKSWQLQTAADPTPEFLWVNPWSFYPQMSARTIAEAEFTFEEHLLTDTQMRALGRQNGFDKAKLAELLKEKTKQAMPNYVTLLASITGVARTNDARYRMWEYHGPLEHEEALTILEASGDHELIVALEADPLAEYRVILFFCEGKLLKFSLHPLDSGETLYSVFNFEQDDSSIFGFGVPNMMADSQSALNGGWRMVMDNAGLSVGPQIVIDKSSVEPEDGSWLLEPRKVWTRKTAALQGAAAVFEVHNIPNNQADLTGIISMARQFADDETNMPLIAQGEQASHVTPTMGGMSILMNSANVVFRRVIKMYDDDITTPNLRRAYDWNMQFNPKPEIKGDMSVDARGSSVLLVRELQATNLMQITNGWSGNPILGKLLKVAPAMRKTVQALMIAADEVVMSDDEIAAMVKAESAKPAPPTPEEVKVEIAKIAAKSRGEVSASAEKVAMINQQTEMMRLAEQRNMTLDDLQAKLHMKTIETNSKERIMAAEVGAEAQKAQQAHTLGQKEVGSGGYL